MSTLPSIIPGDPTQTVTPKATIDLRSDTVTKPTPEMRHAMFTAEVGDDVYGEDPTVNRLEKRAAEIFARESAIFVPTGSMGNQIAIKIHTQPGQEIICEERAHVFNWEMATLSSFSGCLVRPAKSSDGSGHLAWDDIRPFVSPKIYYRAQTGLIVLENTHNMAGGTVAPAGRYEEVTANAKTVGIPTHLDGARIFNASIASNKSVAELTAGFDSVMFCLSKGLGAPIGSLLVGARNFIEKARVYRKALGGGMRQVGVLAAAGSIALEKMPARLQEDHQNARFIADGLSRISEVKIDLEQVHSNIVIFEVLAARHAALDITRKLAEKNVLCSAIGQRHIRLVTHMDVTREDCSRALAALDSALTA